MNKSVNLDFIEVFFIKVKVGLMGIEVIDAFVTHDEYLKPRNIVLNVSSN